MTLSELKQAIKVIYMDMLSDAYIEHPEHIDELLVHFGSIPRSINIGSLDGAADIQGIWNKLGEYPDGILRDSFLTASARFRLQVSGFETGISSDVQEELWSQMVDLVAGCLGHIRDTGEGKASTLKLADTSVMNTDFKDRGVGIRQWSSILQRDSWVIFILLLRLLSIDHIQEMQTMIESKRRKKKPNHGEL